MRLQQENVSWRQEIILVTEMMRDFFRREQHLTQMLETLAGLPDGELSADNANYAANELERIERFLHVPSAPSVSLPSVYRQPRSATHPSVSPRIQSQLFARDGRNFTPSMVQHSPLHRQGSTSILGSGLHSALPAKLTGGIGVSPPPNFTIPRYEQADNPLLDARQPDATLAERTLSDLAQTRRNYEDLLQRPNRQSGVSWPSDVYL